MSTFPSVSRYRVCNWPAYNRALIDRGRLTVWFDDHFKRLFGGRLWARDMKTQRAEAVVKCAVLNRMVQLGMPETVRVG